MFVADIMLVKVARWLRILGVSVETPKLKSDNDFLKYAKDNRLILLTMDVELGRRAAKYGVTAFLVPKKSLEGQVIDIFREFSLSTENLPSKTLCSLCNGKLGKVEKETVRDKLEEKTLEKIGEFWECEKCGHVFWEGSHWRRIADFANELKKELKN